MKKVREREGERDDVVIWEISLGFGIVLICNLRLYFSSLFSFSLTFSFSTNVAIFNFIYNAHKRKQIVSIWIKVSKSETNRKEKDYKNYKLGQENLRHKIMEQFVTYKKLEIKKSMRESERIWET